VARHLFGSIADYVVAPGDSVTVGDITGSQTLLVPGTVVTFWTDVSGGSQYTDLLDLTSAPIMSVTTDANGAIPQFYGPDGVYTMYADAGGDRRAIEAIDLGTDIVANASGIATLQATVSTLAPVASTGNYSDLNGVPTLATVASTGNYSDLNGTPPPGMQVVEKVGGSWPLRATTAPDTSRTARWIGPAPAPPAGSGYALDRDIWEATVA
jgi:hypothetical protein